jgi:hypothetical protein
METREQSLCHKQNTTGVPWSMLLFSLVKNGCIEPEKGIVSFWERTTWMTLKLVEFIKELPILGEAKAPIASRKWLRAVSRHRGSVVIAP